MLVNLDDFMGVAAVSLRSSLKYRRNWNKNGPTVQLLRKFMPRNSKGYRLYIPIGKNVVAKPVVTPPLQVRHAIKQAGFRITDYLAKKCVKLSDKDQKNVFNIGKVIAKDPVAKAAFDNDPQLQNSNSSEFTMVVSCHPYDIIGMSTGRSWDTESCMRLADDREGFSNGMNKHYLERDVAEGTLVCYAVRTADTNIEKPLGRCLLKPFLREDENTGEILYRRETSIYGNPVPGFSDTMQRFLRKLNAGIPAGIYRLNEQLYNDGVGGRHEQEDSGARPDGRVDWAVVDDDAKLEERPDLYPSFVEYMINNYRNDIGSASSVINNSLQKAGSMPDRYIKQASRLLASDDALVHALLDAMYSGFNGAEFIPKFLKAKEMRDAIMRVRREYDDKQLRNMPASTLISAKDAHAYFEEMPKSTESYFDNAYLLLEGYMSLSAADIMSIPEFHKIVYVLANMNREASAFDFEKYQETSHKYLNTLTPVDTKLNADILEPMCTFLRNYHEYRYPAGALALNMLKDNDANATKILLAIGRGGFIQLFKSRKFARRFMTQKNPSLPLRALVAQATYETIDNHAGNNESIARDVLTILQKLPSFDAVTPYTYYNMLRVEPRLYPILFYSQFDANSVDSINSAIKYIPSVDTCMAVLGQEGSRELKPAVPEQNDLWDLHGTLMHLSAYSDTEIIVPYNEDRWVNQMVANIGKVERLEDLQVDLARYPQLLNASSAKMISPMEFIGADNGATFADQAARLGIYALSDIIDSVFKKDPMTQIYRHFTKSGLDDSGHLFVRDIKTAVQAGNKEKLQEWYDYSHSYVKKLEGFYNWFLPEPGDTFMARFGEHMGYTPEETQEGAPAILSMISTLKLAVGGAQGVLKLFDYMAKGEIEMDQNPLYKMPE